MIVKARLTPQNQGNVDRTGKAQVTVLLGEGSGRHSVTRHVQLAGDKWMGRNPDKVALLRHLGAERAFREASFAFAETTQHLKELENSKVRNEAMLGNVRQRLSELAMLVETTKAARVPITVEFRF